MSSIYNPSPPKFVSITTVPFTIPAGAAGWIDTDVSASINLGSRALLFRIFINGGNNTIGIRPAGSAVNNADLWAGGSRSFGLISDHTNGHVELYRDAAADNIYYLEGYFL